jgi:2-keto-4-pentenoate hydratase/2-oxohepta-3-ene-1,7-dioic acid hydratase in catechol pathway
VWLKHGDRVEVDIERVGRLQNTVQDEQNALSA